MTRIREEEACLDVTIKCCSFGEKHLLCRLWLKTRGVFNNSSVEQTGPLGCWTGQLLDKFHPYPVEQNGSDCRQAIHYIEYRLPAIEFVLLDKDEICPT